MIPLAAAFTAGFALGAGYSIRKVRGLRRMIVADRRAALRQAVWRAGREPETITINVDRGGLTPAEIAKRLKGDGA